MRQRKTEAIILNATEVFDADRSYLLFTREYGKLRARARGVRRPTSRLTGHLLAFLPTEVELVEQGGWFLIVQAQIVRSGSYPEDTLQFLGNAEVVAEGMNLLLVEQEPHPVLYEGLRYSLERLREGKYAPLVVAEYLLKCLVELGYRPELEQSVVSGEPLRAEALFWSSELGGVLNRGEGPGERLLPISSPQVVVALRQLVRPQFLAERLGMDEAVRDEVVRIIFDFFQSHLGKPLRSLGLLGW